MAESDRRLLTMADVAIPQIPMHEIADALPTWGKRLLNTSKKRAASLGMEHTLTPLDLWKLIRRADGKCMMTGIPFDFAKSEDHYHRPFMPSLDRIRSDRGYTRGNVRLTCVAVNVAMKQWGEGVILQIARALVDRADRP